MTKGAMSNEAGQYNSTAWQFQLDPVNHWAYWDNAFTAEECQKIIEIGKSKTLMDGTVNSNKKSEVRKSQVSWIYANEGVDWIYERMTNIVCNLNNSYFGFDIFGALEGLQFTTYEAPGSKYGKHIDSAYNRLVRKLSFTLQLSDEKDYEGGDLCLHLDDEPTKIPRKQGYVCVFPSYVLHEVTPVTKGTRYSLVSWISGKPFK
jgi:PKHD-type hydroxylase